jgi:hypothetical protein
LQLFCNSAARKAAEVAFKTAVHAPYWRMGGFSLSSGNLIQRLIVRKSLTPAGINQSKWAKKRILTISKECSYEQGRAR